MVKSHTVICSMNKLNRHRVLVSVLCGIILLSMISPSVSARDRTRTVTIEPNDYVYEKIDITSGRIGFQVGESSGDFNLYVFEESQFLEYEKDGLNNATAYYSSRRVSTIDDDISVSSGPSYVVFENAEDEMIEMTYLVFYASQGEIWRVAAIFCGVVILIIVIFVILIRKWKGWSHSLADRIFGKGESKKSKKEVDDESTEEEEYDPEDVKALREEVERLKKEREMLKRNKQS